MAGIFGFSYRLADHTIFSNPFNPAFIHPDDMAAMDICEDQIIEIESDYGKMRALAHADKTMRRSVICSSIWVVTIHIWWNCIQALLVGSVRRRLECCLPINPVSVSGKHTVTAVKHEVHAGEVVRFRAG